MCFPNNYNGDDVSRCSSLNVWNGIGRHAKYICIDMCLNLKLLFVFDVVYEVVIRNIMHPRVLSKYAAMAMVALWFSSLNVWNGVALTLDGPTGSSFY